MAAKAASLEDVSANMSNADLAEAVATLGKALAALAARVAALETEPAKPANGAAVAAVVAVAAAAPVASATAAAKPTEDPMDGVHEILRRLLAVGLEPDADGEELADEQFFRFLELIHTERKGTPMLESSLRQYAFRQLRKNAPIYLRDRDDTGTYDVTRSEPREISTKTERVKVFLRAATRMPTPIALRRDAIHQGAWRIETTSL